MKLIKVLERLNYRPNLDCSDINILNLEISVNENSKKKLEKMGVYVQPAMRKSTSNHSLYTTAMTAEYLKNAKVDLFENDLSAFDRWYKYPKNYQIVGLSISAFNVSDIAQKYMSNTSFMNASSGNSGKATGYPQADKWFSLFGACDFNNILRPYSSYGLTNIDFVGYDGFEYMGKELKGTSYSRPLIGNIIAGQFFQLFKNKYKVFPTPKQMYYILKRHSVDIEDIGFDEKSGFGIPVIPEKDENIKFFDKIDIPEEIVQCVRLVADGGVLYIHNELGVNLAQKPHENMLAYLIRRALVDNKLTIENVVFNEFQVNAHTLRKLVLNSSIYIDKMESGKM